MKKLTTRTMAYLGLFSAISIILVWAIHFPILPAANFLVYDPADIPIIIATFLFGPLAGILITAVVSVLQWLLLNPEGGWIGAVMHILATGSLVITAGLIYSRKKTRTSAVIALVSGVIVMTASMVIWNLLLTPIFYGMPFKAVLDMLLPAIIPFNLIKSVANSVLAFLVYKTVGKVIKH